MSFQNISPTEYSILVLMKLFVHCFTSGYIWYTVKLLTRKIQVYDGEVDKFNCFTVTKIKKL